MSKVKNYLSLIKFSHTIFAMPFAMIGLFLGFQDIREFDHNKFDNQWQDSGARQVFPSARWLYDVFFGYEAILVSLLVIFCMIFARSAAMAFNRYLDRRYDAKNPRTAIREIPSGVITPKAALIFTIVSCVLFVTASFFINKICFYLSPVALIVVLGYSYTKRFTPLCHLILGLGLSLAPVGAWLAVTGRFDLLPVLFSLAVLFWVSGFDIIYALQDEEFDRSQQLYSIPAWLGKSSALRISEFLHLLSAAAVIIAGLYAAFGWLYWAGATLFTGMLIYQHSVVKPTDLRKVNIAFMTANGIASVVFAIFVIADLLINIK